MAFKQGRVKTGGRLKGIQNKSTVKVKEAIETAFHELGGANYLVELGENDPKTFITLLVKLLPSELKVAEKADKRENWASDLSRL